MKNLLQFIWPYCPSDSSLSGKGNFPWVVYFALFTCFIIPTSNAQVVESDSLALVAFYNSLDGDNWTDNTNWKSAQPVGTWKGITLNGNRVQRIRLDQNNLSGQLPSSVYDLDSLTWLDVAKNQVEGAIPTGIDQLTKLFLFYVNENAITSVPASLANIPSLERVTVNKNQLVDFPNLSALNNMKILNIRENQLTFEDIEPNIDVASILFSYTPQDSVLDYESYSVSVGDPLSLSAEVGGVNNQYQWYKDGAIIPGATSATYDIDEAVETQTGIYTCAITNSVATDLILWRRTIELDVPTVVLPADSLVLVDFYNATDGLNWTTTWDLNAPVIEWEGVVIESGKVKELSLPDNNLTGTLNESLQNLDGLEILTLNDNNLDGAVPEWLTELSELSFLDISDNQFEDCADLSSLSPFTIYMDHNKFTFTDIIPTLASGVVALYAPQDSVLQQEVRGFEVGDDIAISAAVDTHFLNYYIWFKDGAIIAQGQQTTHAELIIENASAADQGIYTCQIINASANSLTLNRRPVALLLGGSNALIQDSLALVAFYDALDGDNWDNNSNWKVPGVPIGDWHGITTDPFLNKVTEISLANNALVGELGSFVGDLDFLEKLILNSNDIFGQLPPEIGNLTKLEFLRLYFNEFTGPLPEEITNMESLVVFQVQTNAFTTMPDLQDLPDLQQVVVNNNQLGFDDLEPNMNASWTYFAYDPQDSVLENELHIVDIGADKTLNSEIPGSGNIYQWYKDGDILLGEINDSYTIENATEADSGLYTCEVKSTLVPDLSLWRKGITVRVEDLVTQLSAEQDESLLQTFPNPFGDQLVVRIGSSQLSQPVQLVVRSANGQIVFKRNMSLGLEVLETGDWSPGVYFAELHSAESVHQTKVIKY